MFPRKEREADGFLFAEDLIVEAVPEVEVKTFDGLWRRVTGAWRDNQDIVVQFWGGRKLKVPSNKRFETRFVSEGEHDI